MAALRCENAAMAALRCENAAMAALRCERAGMAALSGESVGSTATRQVGSRRGGVWAWRRCRYGGDPAGDEGEREWRRGRIGDGGGGGKVWRCSAGEKKTRAFSTRRSQAMEGMTKRTMMMRKPSSLAAGDRTLHLSDSNMAMRCSSCGGGERGVRRLMTWSPPQKWIRWASFGGKKSVRSRGAGAVVLCSNAASGSAAGWPQDASGSPAGWPGSAPASSGGEDKYQKQEEEEEKQGEKKKEDEEEEEEEERERVGRRRRRRRRRRGYA
eukprot:TRINITY_DN12508_c1_g2_i3.p1 TRINITY_DN12508_c1_g2~~TRINITY_DN12508_c1_g2_i3.p1  ORF type:complete len:284 (-),score=76.73 TRINITY_DN12508_c1_g2_i3:198-1004(-)